MKKASVLSLFLMILSIFVFASCAKKPNYSGFFSQEEFVYSIGQEIDFYDHLTLKGVGKDEVVLSLSGDIATKTQNVFKMTNSGRGLLTAKKDNQTIASAKVIVKQQFAAPQKLFLNENGVITWDETFAIFDGEVVKAGGYKIMVGEVEIPLITNSFILPSYGVYNVKVKALAKGYCDESEYSLSQTFEYGVMNKVSNVQLLSQDIISGGAMTLSWTGVENANYDVYVSGIRIATNISRTSVDVNFANLAGGRSVEVQIVANDNRYINQENKYFSSTYSFSIVKPIDLQPEYVIENGEGYLRWRDVVGANKYVVAYSNLNNSNNSGYLGSQTLFKKDGYVYSLLEGLHEGIYDITIQAKGGNTLGNYSCDGNTASISKIAKLAKTNYTYSFDNQKLILDILQNSHSNEFLIDINNQKFNTKSESEFTFEKDLSFLNFGENIVRVKNLPELDNEDYSVTIGDYTTSKVIGSDFVEYKLYKLKDIENLTHTLSGQNSKFVFDKVEDANAYKISLNGEIIQDKFIENLQGKIEIVVTNLSNYNPVGNDYNFIITAYRLDGSACEQSVVKTISILSSPIKAEQQENGYFKWNSLADEGVEYRYSIYNADKDYNITGVHAENIGTQDCQTQELPFGYYVIKVWGLSTNTDIYLDSDFGEKIENNFLQENFYVYEQIQTPQLDLNFDDGEDVYKLTIHSVEHATTYEIFLNNESIAIISPPDLSKDSFIYRLSSRFESDNDDRATFEIKVVAKVNSTGDSNLHPASNASQLDVVRLEKPTFTVTDDELLTVNKSEGVSSVEIKQAGGIVNQDGSFSISLKDVAGLKQTSFIYRAIGRQENTIYLDSGEKIYTFQRLDISTNLAFNIGEISYQNASHENVEKYVIKLVLVNSDLGDKEIIIQPVEGMDFNLNDYLESMRDDEEFYNLYAQCQAIKVSVMAYRLGYKDKGGIFFLPSAYSSPLTLTKLDKPVVNFDIETLILSWNSVGEAGNTTYSIYVDGKKFAEGITANIYSLSSLDFSTAKQIVVFAENSAYLSSAGSDKIQIRKLSPINTFNVANDILKIYSNIKSADLGDTEFVQINGENVKPNISGEIILDLNSSVVNYSIKLIGYPAYKVDGVTNYIISSDIRNFKFYDLSSFDANLKNQDQNISWNGLGEEFKGQTGSPLSYKIVVKNVEGLDLSVIQGLNENSISLTDSRLFDLQPNKYKLQILTDLVSYTITADQSGAIGYFGSKDFGTLDISKEKQLPKDYSYYVESSSSTNPIDKRVNGDLKIRWANIWGEERPLFDILASTGITMVDEKLVNLKAGSEISIILYGKIASLQLVENNTYYEFTMYSKVVNQFFTAGVVNIPVVVHSGENIPSNTTTLSIRRLENVEDLKLSPEGVLSYYSYKASNFVIELTMGGKTQYIQTNQSSINLWEDIDMFEGIKNFTGKYTIRVLADANTGAIPADMKEQDKDKFTINGYRMVGASEVVVESNGNVKISITEADKQYILSGLTFDVVYNGVQKSFEPHYDDKQDVYIYSTNEFIQLFEDEIKEAEGELTTKLVFEIIVKNEDCVNSAAKSFAFNYSLESQETLVAKREQKIVDGVLRIEKDKDYLVILGNVENTTGLWIELRYLKEVISENPDGEDPIVEYQEVIEKLAINGDDIRGYWIENQDGSCYFSKVLPSLTEATPCFTLDVSSVLESLDNGEYTFYISRIAKDENGEVTQYASAERVFKKLASVDSNSVRLVNENILWSGVDYEGITGYYINFYSRSEDTYTLVNKIEINTATSYNLTEVIKTASTGNYITISSISSTEGVLASKETLRFIVGRYSQPSKLEVVEGVLQYSMQDIRNMELLADISQNFSNFNNLIEKVVTSVYKIPFNFTANNISNVMVRLTFEDTTTAGKTYYVTMKAVDLLAAQFKTLDFVSESSTLTYFDALVRIKRYFQNNSHAYASQMINLVSSIENSSWGLAGKITLFDDYGEAVPAGNYKVSIRQEGVGFDNVNHEGMIPSNYSLSTTLQILETPSIQLHRDSRGNTNTYYLSFKQIQINGSFANHYKLNIRDSKSINEYSIKKVGDNWLLYYFDENVEKSFILSTTSKDGYITIDLSNDFARKINDLDGTTKKVAVYAVGNSEILNSKTDTISMTILDFNYSTLKLEKGVLSWSLTKGDQGTLVSYKHTSSSPTQQIITTSSRHLNLTNPGLYEYVMFMALGGISNNSVVVDSESYLLANVYKRSTPTVSVGDGSFVIANSALENSEYIDYLEFEISNNQGDGLAIVKQELQTSQQKIYYHPGEYDGEKLATQFYFKAIGKSIEKTPIFSAVKTSNEELGDYLLTQILQEGEQETKIVLSSQSYQVNAKMLDSVEKVKIENGDIEWQANQQTLSENYMVVYKIDIYAYKSQQEDLGFKNMATFYTTNKKLETKLVPYDENYLYYTFAITSIGCSKSTSTNANAIKTIEGEYILLSNAKFEDNSYALSSQEKVFGNKRIVKLEDITDVSIEEGNITQNEISIKKQGILINYPGSVIKDITGFKVLDQDGNQISGSLYGMDSNKEIQENYYNYKNAEGKDFTRIFFIPNNEALSFEHGIYVFTVYAYRIGTQDLETSSVDDYTIFSNAITLSKGVYQLRKVEKSELEFNYNLQTDNYTLDFTNYFKRSGIAGSSNHTTLKIKVENKEKLIEIYITNQNMILTIKKGDNLAFENSVLTISGGETFSIKAIFNTSFKDPASNVYFESGEEIFILQNSTFGDESEIEWDESNKLFKWTDTSFNQVNEYIIRLTYQNNSTEVSNILKFDSQDMLSYQPLKMGTIIRAEVFVRSQSFALFSSPLLAEAEFNFNLFNGGNGSKESPYEIANEEQFNNIQLRNQSSTDYYFVLTRDIDLHINNGFVLNDAFYGKLDGKDKVGNTHTINVVIDSLGEMDMLSHYLPGSRSATETRCDFSQGASIFKSIASKGIVQNINISVNVNLPAIEKGSIIAPLAQSNYGKIANINIVNVESNLALGEVSRIAVAFAGLVGDNYGNISGCQNSASFELLVDAPRNNIPYLLYSGIALRSMRLGNNTGLIANCFSTGNVVLTASKLNSIIWAGGIVSNLSNSRVYNCGVEGQIKIERRGTISCSTFLGGIALYSNNSNIQYCYNNASLLNSINQQNNGGIAYIIEGGTVKGLVETSGLAIASRVSALTGDTCYADQAVEGLTSIRLIAVEINAYNGYILKVVEENGGYKASIVQA